jgi:hypothetical protein
VHCVGHDLPAFDLAIGKDARCPGIALALLADLRGFAHDQACTSTLRVIERVEAGRFVGLRFGTAAGERRHDDTVGRFERTECDGVEKGGIAGHGNSDDC